MKWSKYVKLSKTVIPDLFLQNFEKSKFKKTNVWKAKNKNNKTNSIIGVANLPNCWATKLEGLSALWWEGFGATK